MNIEGKTDKQLRGMCVNHWKRMLKLTVRDIKQSRDGDGKDAPTANNCAFCVAYSDDSCRGCPIQLKAGKRICENTPYLAAYRLYDDIADGNHRRIKAFHKAVQKEIDFLESLECQNEAN